MFTFPVCGLVSLLVFPVDHLLYFFAAWFNDSLKADFDVLLSIRKSLNIAKVKISDSVLIYEDNDTHEKMAKVFTQQNLTEIWQVASVKLFKDKNMQSNEDLLEISGLKMKIVPSDMEVCPRCRLYVSKTSDELCDRCKSAVQV